MTMSSSEVFFSGIVNLYESPESFFKEAFLSLSITNPKIKQEYAIYLYKKESISLAKAAEVAGMSFFEFTELLQLKKIPLKTAESTATETRNALEYLKKNV